MASFRKYLPDLILVSHTLPPDMTTKGSCNIWKPQWWKTLLQEDNQQQSGVDIKQSYCRHPEVDDFTIIAHAEVLIYLFEFFYDVFSPWTNLLKYKMMVFLSYHLP